MYYVQQLPKISVHFVWQRYVSALLLFLGRSLALVHECIALDMNV